MNSARLYVCGIPFSTTKHDLREYFEPLGEIVDIFLPYDKTKGPGRNKGFAFIEFKTIAIAQQVVDVQNNRPGPGGRKIEVREADAKPVVQKNQSRLHPHNRPPHIK